jgi:hypothetical protein
MKLFLKSGNFSPKIRFGLQQANIWREWILLNDVYTLTPCFFRELRKVHGYVSELMKLDSDQVWKPPTGESLPRKWAVDLEEYHKRIQVR